MDLVVSINVNATTTLLVITCQVSACVRQVGEEGSVTRDVQLGSLDKIVRVFVVVLMVQSVITSLENADVHRVIPEKGEVLAKIKLCFKTNVI